jgi:hypothetical protein
MVKHIDSWFAFAHGLGLGIEHMEDIILITGLHLTRSWANIVFLEGNVYGRASLGVRVNDGRAAHLGAFEEGCGVGPEGKVCWVAKYSEIISA